MKTEPLSTLGGVHYSEFISGLIHSSLSLERIAGTERTRWVAAHKEMLGNVRKRWDPMSYMYIYFNHITVWKVSKYKYSSTVNFEVLVANFHFLVLNTTQY